MKPSKLPAIRMCAYCRGVFHKSYLTKDHIPPQGIYGKEWRKGKELHWVDCCRACREGQHLGDEALKAMIALGAHRNPHVERIRPEVDRGLLRKSWWRDDLVDGMNDSEDITLFGSLSAIKLTLPIRFSAAVDEAVRRIAIAILFRWNHAFDPAPFQLEVKGRNEGDLSYTAPLIEWARGLPNWFVVDDGVFQANWDFLDNQGLMVLSFYDTLTFFVFFNPPTQLANP